jgi:eukaryotic-like serine/threonine-protein kinase
MESHASAPASAQSRLDSWKEIATYLRRDVRTLQRWEKEEGLPVHRLVHGKQGTVYAIPSELDVWWESRRLKLEHPDALRRARDHVVRWSMVAALGVIVGIAAWSVWHAREPAARGLSRLTITLPDDETLVNDVQSVAISPDGRRVAYVARRGDTRQIYVRPLDQYDARPIVGTEGAQMPFFSPDARWVGFFASGKLQKVSLAGGLPVTLCDAPNGRGADWGSDDSIIFAPDSTTGLFQVSSAGGAPRAVTTLDRTKGEVSHRAPQILPGGKAVLFTVLGGPQSPPNISVQLIVGGKRGTLVDGGEWARYVPGGHLIYGYGAAAMTRPFDVSQLVSTGPPVSVAEDLGASLLNGLWQFAVSADGSLAFIPSGRAAASRRALVWVDRQGVAAPLATERHPYETPRLSPDGQRLALRIDEPADTGVWIYELTHDRLTRLASEGNNQGSIGSLVWSPDGARIVFSYGRSGPLNMFVRASDGSGPIDRLRASDLTESAGSWSPDGRMLSFVHVDPTTQQDIWALSLEAPGTPRPIVRLPGYQFGDRISPDGRWLAYVSDESGQWETYVTSFPNGNGKWQISSGGGTQPVWARNGRELFYRSGDKLMVVRVDTRTGFAPGKPTLVFDGRYLTGAPGFPAYDVDLDGQRFVMIRTSGEDEVTKQVNVVLGWADELARRERVLTR